MLVVVTDNPTYGFAISNKTIVQAFKDATSAKIMILGELPTKAGRNEVDNTYLAVVHGRLLAQTIEHPMDLQGGNGLVGIRMVAHADGKPSKTPRKQQT
jgi:hypothetical protein